MNTHFRHFAAAIAFAVASLPGASFAHGDEDHGAAGHGNHDPHHGGFVMMYQDLHIELVMPATGGVLLYYTDEARAELPAAVVSDVAVEIERSGARPEAVDMSISPGGDFWQGQAKALADGKAVIRVAFLFNGKPALFNVSAANLPQFVKLAGNAHTGHHG